MEVRNKCTVWPALLTGQMRSPERAWWRPSSPLASATPRSRIGIVFCRSDGGVCNEGGAHHETRDDRDHRTRVCWNGRTCPGEPGDAAEAFGIFLRWGVCLRQRTTECDPCQSLLNAAESENANIVQKLEDPNNAKLLRQEGVGLLPIVQGPNTKIVSPVTEATQMPKRSLAVRVRRGAFTKCPPQTSLSRKVRISHVVRVMKICHGRVSCAASHREGKICQANIVRIIGY